MNTTTIGSILARAQTITPTEDKALSNARNHQLPEAQAQAWAHVTDALINNTTQTKIWRETTDVLRFTTPTLTPSARLAVKHALAATLTRDTISPSDYQVLTAPWTTAITTTP